MARSAPYRAASTATSVRLVIPLPVKSRLVAGNTQKSHTLSCAQAEETNCASRVTLVALSHVPGVMDDLADVLNLSDVDVDTLEDAFLHNL